MTTSADLHRSQSPSQLACAVVTVSDTRTVETDTSGKLIVDYLQSAGHSVIDRTIVRDEPAQIRPLLERLIHNSQVQAVLLTGGTGVSPRDQTYETVLSLLTKPLVGYGELFRMLSYAEIGPACLLSRAVGGLVGRTVILTMPGSTAAVKLAMEKIILPELPHMVREANKV